MRVQPHDPHSGDSSDQPGVAHGLQRQQQHCGTPFRGQQFLPEKTTPVLRHRDRAMLITRYIPCTLYKKMVYPLLLASALLLVLLFVPGLGRKVGGAYRWMNVGRFFLSTF
jgi:hypothetical protein